MRRSRMELAVWLTEALSPPFSTLLTLQTRQATMARRLHILVRLAHPSRTLEERDRRRLTLYSYDLVPPSSLATLHDRRRLSLDDVMMQTTVRRRDEWYLEQERRKQAGEA
ncbi:hypothetical protein RTBOTA2_002464 [Rhodotorula toruloides]|nr:hypothetical protein RTBOTA2_002464 [Rhodotorula toruloides]